MPRKIQYNDREFSFADDVDETKIATFLRDTHRAPDTADVLTRGLNAVPPMLAGNLNTAVRFAKDIGNTLGGDFDTSREEFISKEIARDTAPPPNMTLFQRALYGAPYSLAVTAPALAVAPFAVPTLVARGMPLASAVTRAAVAGAAAVSVPTGLQSYGTMRDAGLGVGRSFTHALADYVSEFATEITPLRVLTGAGGKGFWSTFRRYVGQELGGEEINTGIQSINAKLSYNPDLTMKQYLEDAAVTALSVGLTGPIQAAAGIGAAEIASPFLTPEASTPSQAGDVTGTPSVEAPTPNAPLGRNVVDLLARPNADALVQSTPATKNIVDLQQLARESRPTPEGAARLYYVEQEGADRTNLPLQLIFTTSLSDAQDEVNALGGRAKVSFVNETVKSLDMFLSKADEETRRQITKPGTEFVIPSGTLSAATTLYEPGMTRKETPVTTGQPVATSAPPAAMPGAAPIVTPPAAPAVNRGATGKVKLEFPTELEKTLYETGKALSQKKGIAKAEKRLTELALARGTPASQLKESAVAYYKRANAEIKKQPKGAKYMAPTQKEVPLPPDDLGASEVDVSDQSLMGTVTIAKDFQATPHVERIQALLQRWVRIFAPNMRAVIAGQSPPGFLGRVKMDIDGVARFFIPSADRGTLVVAMNLAHEFGHALVYHHLYRGAKDGRLGALMREHEALVTRVETMTAGEFIKEWAGVVVVAQQKQYLDQFAMTVDSPAMDYVRARDEMHDSRYLETFGPKAFAEQQKRMPSYTLSFNEYAAEQVARYVGRNFRELSDTPEGFTSWTKELIATLKEFFETIVAKLHNQPKFQKFLDDLRAASPSWHGIPESLLRVVPKEFQELDVDERMKYTTKVLSRLPSKPMVKKITVYGEMARADVRAQEKAIIARVLASFPGDSVSTNEFKRAVMAEIVPLTMKASNQYAAYGLTNIGLEDPRGRAPGGFGPAAISHIWRMPYEVDPRGNHFNDDHYFGHTRSFFMRNAEGRDIVLPSYHVVEVQSDVVQKQGKLTEEERDRLSDTLQGLKTDIAKFNMWGNWLNKESVVADMLRHPGALAFYNEEKAKEAIPQEWRIVNAVSYRKFAVFLTRTLDSLKHLETEFTTKLNASQFDFSGLPKNWWELLIREEIRFASNSGFPTMRIATADTVAEVEGWAESPLDASLDFDTHWVEEQDSPTTTKEFVVVEGIPQLEGVKYDTEDQAQEAVQAFIMSLPLRDRIPEELRSIYDRYNTEIPKFLKREFGAKLVWDGNAAMPNNTPSEVETFKQISTGNSWWEFPLLPDQKDLEIQYFELDGANEEASESVASLVETPDNPSAPAAIRAFPKTMLAVLQLNQMAKLMPNVPGLQAFRRLMQNMANIKNQLMAGPNERIREWYRISRAQKTLVEKFIRDEINGGVHITTLEQAVEDVGGVRTVRWKHLPNDALRREFARLGISEKGAALYIGIKNDFLLDLDIMERMVLKSIDKYFRSNPIAGRHRRTEAQREFQKLRDTPYFPDRRFGKWIARVVPRHASTIDGVEIKAGETVHRAHFETRRARDRYLEKIKGAYGDRDFKFTADYLEDSIYVMRGLPREFMQTVADTLQLTPDQFESLKQIQYDYTKEGTFFKLLGRGKKNIGGASTDLRRVYADYHWRTANMIAKMLHSQQLKEASTEVKLQAKVAAETGDTSNLLDMLHERLEKTMDYVMRPSYEFENLRAIVSLWYLWAVPKTALMNFMSMPVFGYGYLAQRYGDVSATVQLMRAMKDVATSKWNSTVFSDDERSLLSRAKEDGVRDQSFAAEMASASTPSIMETTFPQWEWFQDSGASDSIKKATWVTVELGMKPFRLIEEFNRTVMLLSAYRLELAKGGATISSGDPSAYLKARDAVDETQNEYNPWNRPAIMQGKQSLFLIFYSFIQHSMFFTLGGDKGWWRAWLVLLGLAGVQGLPLVDDLITIVNAVWTKISGERVDFRKEGRELAKAIGANPDLVMHGATHNLFGLGWDASYSVGFGNIIPGLESAFSDGDFDSNMVRFLAEAGGPFSSLSVNFLKALYDDNANVLLRFERLAPTTLRNVSRAGRMAADGVMTDNNGRTLVEGSSALAITGQALGFSPNEKSVKQEMLAMGRDWEAYYLVRREHFMAIYHQAKKAEDDEKMDAIRAEIDEFNDRVPYSSLRITGASLAESSRRRAKAEKAQEEGTTTQRRYKKLYEELEPLFNDEESE